MTVTCFPRTLSLYGTTSSEGDSLSNAALPKMKFPTWLFSDHSYPEEQSSNHSLKHTTHMMLQYVTI